MSKYDEMYGYSSNGNRMEDLIAPGENMLLQLKPKKNAFLINQATTMLPFALIWLLFDSMFIGAMFMAGDQIPSEMRIGMVFFFLIHLMPVWIWLANVLTAGKKWKNAEYGVTDKRIIIKNGFIGMNYDSVYYTDISNVELRIQLIDKLCGVGDVIIYTNFGKKMFLDIPNPHQAYQQIQGIVLDMQSDIHYPNAMRPEENPGYHTTYTGRYQ